MEPGSTWVPFVVIEKRPEVAVRQSNSSPRAARMRHVERRLSEEWLVIG